MKTARQRWWILALALLLAGLAITVRVWRGTGVTGAIRQLQAEDTRWRAAWALVWQELPELITTTFPALEPVPASQLHRQAAQELASIGREAQPAVPALLQRLESTQSFELQVAIIRALRQIGPGAKSAIPALIGFHDSLPAQAVSSHEILHALAAIDREDARVVRILLSALQDFRLKGEALEVFQENAGSFNAQMRGELLYLFETQLDLRADLAPIIPRMGGTPEENELFLLGCLRDRTPWVRNFAARMLDEPMLRNPAMIAELRNGLVDLLGARLTALLHSEPNGSAPAWMTQNPEFYGARDLLHALAKAGPSAWESAPLVRTLYDGRDSPLKLESASALWRISGEDDLLAGCFAEGLSGRSDLIKKEQLIQCLREVTLEWPPARELWPSVLQDPDRSYRYHALVQIGQLGKGAAFALPLIRARLQDSSETVRSAAAEALQRIE